MRHLHQHQINRARTSDVYGGNIPFSDWCGLQLVRSTPENTRVLLPYAARVADEAGCIGAGAIATLIDAAAGQVALASLAWRAQVATISLSQQHVGTVPRNCGLIAEGRMIACSGGMVLADIRVFAENELDVVVCEARVRMIVVRQIEELPENRDYPIVTEPSLDQFFGADGMIVERDHDRVTARISSRDHYIGNQTRRSLHGGLVAAALYETLSHLGTEVEPPFAMLDGQVDFLRPARDLEMIVSAEASQMGGRIAFCRAMLEQDVPGQGIKPVARLNATLAR